MANVIFASFFFTFCLRFYPIFLQYSIFLSPPLFGINYWVSFPIYFSSVSNLGTDVGSIAVPGFDGGKNRAGFEGPFSCCAKTEV